MSYTLVYDPSKASRGAARMAFISIDSLGWAKGRQQGRIMIILVSAPFIAILFSLFSFFFVGCELN
jgi:hypothetical protein